MFPFTASHIATYNPWSIVNYFTGGFSISFDGAYILYDTAWWLSHVSVYIPVQYLIVIASYRSL